MRVTYGLLFAALIVAGCSKPGSELYGTWGQSQSGQSITVTFNPDKTFTLASTGMMSATGSGTYEVTEGGNITMTTTKLEMDPATKKQIEDAARSMGRDPGDLGLTLPEGGKTESGTYTVDGTTLNLTVAGQEPMVFTKQ